MRTCLLSRTIRPRTRSTLFPYTTLFRSPRGRICARPPSESVGPAPPRPPPVPSSRRSEEHTSELQSRGHLVCRLLLEKKKNMYSRCERDERWGVSSAVVDNRVR